MTQSRKSSPVEAATNVIVGMLVALIAQVTLSAALGVQATLSQNLALTSVLTALSLLRSSMLRRPFVQFGTISSERFESRKCTSAKPGCAGHFRETV